jgi:hypothetical protein
MIETRFTKLVGAAAPIQAASMPGVSTVELVAAVANPSDNPKNLFEIQVIFYTLALWFMAGRAAIHHLGS